MEQVLAKEVTDRVEYIDENLNPIRDQIETLKKGMVEEKKTRIKNEKEVIKTLYADSAKMIADIGQETENRKEKMQDLDDFLTQDIQMSKTYFDRFELKANTQMANFLQDLDQELLNRFNHQDEMLANMSRFVAKFQDTLKIFGKDV